MNENVVARGKREAKKVNFKKTASIIAIKPLLLILLILVAFVAFVAAVAPEEFLILVLGAVPAAILLVLLLLAVSICSGCVTLLSCTI